jgi:hypothetical protein
MSIRFLFYVGMARENDAYLDLPHNPPVDNPYAGVSLKVAHGWVPDFVDVRMDPESNSCRLTLIELEPSELSALISSRKYLPEDSRAVLRSFADYLDAVIAECRSHADRRIAAFQSLKKFLASAPKISVHAAGGLRSSPDLIEDRPFSDQPVRFDPLPRPAPPPSPPFVFAGLRYYSRAESEALRRAVRILHAVISGSVNNVSTLRSWMLLKNSHLDLAVRNDPRQFPCLKAFLHASTKRGLRVDSDKLARELSAAWLSFEELPIPPLRASSLLTNFVPIARSFDFNDQIQPIFSRARQVIRSTLSP